MTKSKNWTFFSKMAQRIELSFRIVSQRVKLFFFEKWLEEIFSIWLKELNFLFDSKNWTFFFELRLADVIFFSMTHRNVTQRIEPFFFFDCDSKILTFFKMTQRIEPSFLIWLKKWTFFDMPTRIEPFLKKNHSKNWTL